MQFLVALLVVIKIELNRSCDLRVIISCEQNGTNTIKTGDFILDLYWSGCRGDWFNLVNRDHAFCTERIRATPGGVAQNYIYMTMLC